MPDNNTHYYRRDWKTSRRHLTTDGYAQGNAMIQALRYAGPEVRPEAEKALFDFSYTLLNRLMHHEYNLAKEQYLAVHSEMNANQRESLAAALREGMLDAMVAAASEINAGGKIAQWSDYSEYLHSHLKGCRKSAMEKIQNSKGIEPISPSISRDIAASIDLIDELCNMELAEKVQAGLGRLSPKERAVIELLKGLGDGHEYSHEEVTAIIGASPRTTLAIQARAINKLRHAGLQDFHPDRADAARSFQHRFTKETDAAQDAVLSPHVR